MNSTGHKLLSVALCILSGATGWADDRVKFNRDIRPILSDHCFQCHGPDAKQRQAGLRLDVREEVLKAAESGDVAIVPGDLNKSRLWARINSADAAEVMPPPKTSKTLTAAQKGKLRQWIEQGATYEPHWSFLPLASGAMPAVKRGDWSRNDLDRFILARLESEGLAPAPEAAKVTLIRRVSLELNGLPPRLAEVDRDRELWAWRDWVIRAFNDNLPFDQFTIEQIAGDLLPDATRDQRIATGFHRNHMMNEGPTSDRTVRRS